MSKTKQEWLQRVSREVTSTEENELSEGESLQGWTAQNRHSTAARHPGEEHMGGALDESVASWLLE